MKVEEMQHNKLYFISFGMNTQLVVRYKSHDATHIKFYDSIHYWNSFETFHKNEQSNYCVKNGIEEIRRATLPEKHALIKFEFDNDLI